MANTTASSTTAQLTPSLTIENGQVTTTSLLNSTANLPVVVGLLKRGFDMWGCEPLLNFVRGGRTAFKDGCSYDAYGYRNTVATILRQFDKDPALLWNDVRVEVMLQHV